MKKIMVLSLVLTMVPVLVFGFTGSSTNNGMKTMPFNSEIAVIRTMPLKSGVDVIQTLRSFPARNGSCCKAGEIIDIGE